MLHEIPFAIEWPRWFMAEVTSKPMKSELDAWRWAWRKFGSGTFSVRSVGKDLGWTLSSYARPTEEMVDGRRRHVGEAWPTLETLAVDLGVNRRSLTNAAADGDAAGWWIYEPGTRTKDTRFWLSLPLGEPARATPIERPDRRQPGLINGADGVLINGAEVIDQSENVIDQWHKPTENPHPTAESTSRSMGSADFQGSATDAVEIRFTFGAESGRTRVVTAETAAKLQRLGHAELVEDAA